MKFILIALILTLVYVFFPTYDLYIVKEPTGENFTLIETGIYLKKDCVERARLSKTHSYQCRKTSKWAGMYSGYTKYDPSIREAQKRLQDEEDSTDLFGDVSGR